MPGPPVPDSQTTPQRSPEKPVVQLRKALAELPQYVPGAGAANASIFKLSSNELPGPVLPALASDLVDATEEVNRYPQMYADRLTEALAAHHGLSPEQVLVGNGSVALIELLLRAMCADGDEVVYAWRSFEAYPILVQVTGAQAVAVPLTPEGGHDLAAMSAAITSRTKVVMVCTPNNPTSAVISQGDLLAFLDSVPSHVMVILDEAYVDFVRSPEPVDSIPLMSTYKNVVILRTFSKAYGLAGLRIGYALARRRLVRGLRVASTPFGVNALGQVAGLTALRLSGAVRQRVEEIVAERTRVTAVLREQGWQIPDPQGNFYWLRLGDRAVAFAEDAAQSGVMVRPFAGDGVRVTIGEEEANDIALKVAGRWVGSQVIPA